MPDDRRRDQEFELFRGRARGSIAENVTRSLEALLPEEVSDHRTAAWFLTIEQRSRAGDQRYRRPPGGRDLEDSALFLAVSILQPVIQARLDFLAQSLYSIGRVLRVSQRVMDAIRTRSTAPGPEVTLRLDDLQANDVEELRRAVRDSLPGMLTALRETHGRRRGLAARAFEEWVAEADGFRSVFDPVDRLLGKINEPSRSGYGEDHRMLSRIGSPLAGLAIYLSKYPLLGARIEPIEMVAGNRDSLILSPGEVVGILSLTGDRYDPYDTRVTREFGDAVRELSFESLTAAELARLERSIASFDPFAGGLSGPPPESLQAAMRDHVLSNGRRSPWLREFLNRIGRPLGSWDGALASGTAANPEYIADLARSAHATIVHGLLVRDRRAGEPWDAFLNRLFRDEWLKNFRQSATGRTNREHWNRESFIAVGVAVCDQLRRDGYHVSPTEETLATLWDSA
jgi:hypothetical protein